MHPEQRETRRPSQVNNPQPAPVGILYSWIYYFCEELGQNEKLRDRFENCPGIHHREHPFGFYQHFLHYHYPAVLEMSVVISLLHYIAPCFRQSQETSKITGDLMCRAVIFTDKTTVLIFELYTCCHCSDEGN